MIAYIEHILITPCLLSFNTFSKVVHHAFCRLFAPSFLSARLSEGAMESYCSGEEVCPIVHVLNVLVLSDRQSTSSSEELGTLVGAFASMCSAASA